MEVRAQCVAGSLAQRWVHEGWTGAPRECALPLDRALGCPLETVNSAPLSLPVPRSHLQKSPAELKGQGPRVRMVTAGGGGSSVG